MVQFDEKMQSYVADYKRVLPSLIEVVLADNKLQVAEVRTDELMNR